MLWVKETKIFHYVYLKFCLFCVYIVIYEYTPKNFSVKINFLLKANMFSVYQSIGLVGRVFTNDPGDWG